MDTVTELRAFVRDGLKRGDYGEGHRIPPERDLATRFGTSRAAIRKALAVLEVEQLVVREVGRGTFIAAENNHIEHPSREVPPRSSPSELMAAREVFEPQLMRLVVLNATEEDLLKIRTLLQHQKHCAAGAEFEASDIAFHRALAEASRNRVLIDLSDCILRARNHDDWRKLKGIVARRNPGRRWQAIEEHEQIASALEDRDADAAAAQMRHHLSYVRRYLIEGDY